MRRRRLLQMLGLAGGGLFAAGGFAVLRGNRYYDGPVTDHFDGEVFFNPEGPPPRGFVDLLRWKFGETRAEWPESFPSHVGDRPPARVEGEGLRVSYVGHASFLIQTGGRNVLVDPVWAERASPVSFAGPRRVNAPGVAFDDLPAIDAVLISHNHYDHLDVATLARLVEKHDPLIVTPLGNDVIVKDSAPRARTLAADWDEVVDLGSGVRVHLEPTQHWSARGMFDRRHALWASFVIDGPGGKVYAVGDSGLNGGRTFRRVAARHPDIRLALLPIGAYEPRWFMREQHMNPDDAVQALQLCGARQALAHHWGTFQLTNEPIDEPPRLLAEALERYAVDPARFLVPRPGQVWEEDGRTGGTQEGRKAGTQERRNAGTQEGGCRIQGWLIDNQWTEPERSNGPKECT